MDSEHYLILFLHRGGIMLNNEKRYLISRFVNLIGNSIYNICIPLYLLEKFESLMMTGAFFTLVQIPMVVLLPFIGSFLKNKNLKHTMLASNVISVVIFIMVFINEQFFSSSFILFLNYSWKDNKRRLALLVDPNQLIFFHFVFEWFEMSI